MSSPILILGSNGQVGWELQRSLAVLRPVVAATREHCDLASEDAVRSLVSACKPCAIVNAAAYTAVDAAQTDVEQAMQLNAVLPAVLADEATRARAWLIQYSTDYVFDGGKPAPYVEDDATAPLGVYGHSKLAGEHAARACERHVILRTSWVFGVHGGNFLKTMLRLARTRAELRVVDDQHGAPTSAAFIADATAHAVAALAAGRGAAGLYHLASSGSTSWCGYARYVLAEAARLGVPLACPAESVAPIASRDWPAPAQRPANSRLATRRLTGMFGVYPPAWQTQVSYVLQTLVALDDCA